MFCNVFPHTQPTVVFLKFLHLIFDGYIWMPLPKVADEWLAVLEMKIQSLKRGDIRTLSRKMDPGGTMLVNKEIAVEVVKFDLMVRS